MTKNKKLPGLGSLNHVNGKWAFSPLELLYVDILCL